MAASSSFCKPLRDHHHSLIRTRTTTTKHTSSSSSSKPSLLLKDYLRDDLSSCSSSGFKSFPRRQCCTTVDLKLKNNNRMIRKRNSTTLPRPSVSVLQRASVAVINAMKSLTLKSQNKGGGGSCVISRSLSRRLLSGSFWRKVGKKEEGSSSSDSTALRYRRSFRELLMQDRDYKPTSSFNEETHVFSATATSCITTTSISLGCGSSNSWGESECSFSSTTVTSSSDSSTTEIINELPQGSTKDAAALAPLLRQQIGDHGVVTKGDYYDAVVDLLQSAMGSIRERNLVGTDLEQQDWQNEKEQFSPVSVLDFPFEDEEETKSHFNPTSTHSLLEGTEHKHIQKRQHFKSVAASLEPVVLENRITFLELEDEQQQHNHSTMKQCSVQVPIMHIEPIDAGNLLDIVKRSIPPNCFMNMSENLMFDYFEQSIGENCDNIDNSKKLELCKVAEDYILGQSQELYLGWEVQQGRGVYISEMDKYCGEWKKYDKETQQVAMELENDVFTSLVNELVLDLLTY